MLQRKTLGGLMLAAGLWLTASAAMAAPQPEQDMPLGYAALPPTGYLEFCERRPEDCGPDPRSVLAGAQRAEADLRQLLGAREAATSAASTPAARTFTEAPARPTFAPDSPDLGLTAAPEPLQTAVARAEIQTAVAFIDPAAVAREEQEMRAPRMTPRLWALLNRVNGQVNGAIRQQTDVVTYGREEYWNTPLEQGARVGDCEDYVLEKQRALIAAGVPRQALNIATVTTRWGEGHAVLLVATSEGEYVLDNLSPSLVTWREAPYAWVKRQLNGEAFDWVMVKDPSRLRRGAPTGLLIASSR